MDAAGAVLTIVLVNYRGCDDTLECLESLLRLERQDFNVVVCDNLSGDRSVERLSAWARGELAAERSGPPWALLPKDRRRAAMTWCQITETDCLTRDAPMPFLTIVDMGRNAGFAAANNAATRLALRSPSIQHVWYLNNDTVVEPGATAALQRRFASDPAIGQCGATIAFYREPDTIHALGGSTFIRATGRGRHIGLGADRHALPTREEIEGKLMYVSGASLCVSRRLLEDIGLMREDYFLYFEEADLAERSKAKYKLAWAPDAVVWHKEGASIGSKAIGRASDTSLYYLSRNVLAFTARTSPLYLPSVISRLVVESGRYLRRRDWAAVRIIRQAVTDFLMMRSGRRDLQRR